MQFTLGTDYSLRVLMHLAHGGARLATTGEIARAYDVSENHLVKIVHGLVKLGYVQSVRGNGGGIRLARPAAEINLADVVRDTEERLHLVECLAGDGDGACRLVPMCRLKDILKQVQDDLLCSLARYTIEDLVQKHYLSRV